MSSKPNNVERLALLDTALTLPGWVLLVTHTSLVARTDQLWVRVMRWLRWCLFWLRRLLLGLENELTGQFDGCHDKHHKALEFHLDMDPWRIFWVMDGLQVSIFSLHEDIYFHQLSNLRGQAGESWSVVNIHTVCDIVQLLWYVDCDTAVTLASRSGPCFQACTVLPVEKLRLGVIFYVTLHLPGLERVIWASSSVSA